MKLLGNYRILLPVVLWLVSGAFLFGGYRLTRGAGAMPILIGWGMLFLTSLDIVTALPGQFAQRMRLVLNPSQTHRETAVGPAITACIMLVVLAAGLVAFGVVWSVSIFAILALRFGAERNWIVSLSGGALLSLLVWLLFTHLLGLTLFPGLFFGGEW